MAVRRTARRLTCSPARPRRYSGYSASAPPLLIVELDCRHGGVCGGVYPAARPLLEVCLQRCDAWRTCRMDRRNIESHRAEQIEVQFVAGIIAQFDFLGICGDASENEPMTYVEKRI